MVTSLSITIKSTYESLQLGVDESYELDKKPCDLSILSANTVDGAMHGLETFSKLVIYKFSLGYYQISTATTNDKPLMILQGIINLFEQLKHFWMPSVTQN